MSCPAVIHVYANASLPKAVVVATPGPVGPVGSRWLGGPDVPTLGLGSVGDWYIRSNGDVYGPKTVAGWGAVTFVLQHPLSTVPAQPLAATATAGSQGVASDAGHQHPFPTAAQVGAEPTGTAATAVAGHLQAASHLTTQQAAAAAPVQSVALAVPSGWSGSSSNTGGSVTLTLALPAGSSLPSNAAQAQWDTAYSERRQWDGGSTGLVAATARSSLGLGSAAQAATSDFATAAQGALAGTAVQPGLLKAVATSGAYTDLTGKPTLGTASARDVPATGDASATQVTLGSDSRLAAAAQATASAATAASSATQSANSATQAANSAAQAAAAASTNALSTTITAAVTLPAGATAAVAVTLANASLIANDTSLRGVMGAVIGLLARDGAGAYTFAPSVAPVSSTTLPVGTAFVAGAIPANLDPLNISGNIFSRDPAYAEFYSYICTDADNRIGLALKADGQLYVPRAADMSITGNAATATTATTAGSTTSIVTAFGESTANVDLDFYPWVVVSGSPERIGIALTGSGEVYVPSANITTIRGTSANLQSITVGTLNVTGQQSSLTAINNGGDVYAVELVGQNNQIIKYSNGARTQLTTVGHNNSPTLTGETPQRILISSTRTGVQSYQVVNTDGTQLAHAIAPKNLVVWGDSMTDFLGISGFLPAKLGDNRRIVYRGVGGQRSVQIAGRQGGITLTGSITGGQIPASGSVAITGLYPTSAGTNSSLLVTINGIPGTLGWSSGPIFTRATAGSVVTVSNPVTIIPNLKDTVNGIDYDLNEYTSIWWLGRNGVGQDVGAPAEETDVTVYQKMVAKVRNLSGGRKILILPIFNGGFSTESNGDPAIPTTSTAGYDAIMARNNAIAAAFPQYYYDIRRAFIDQSAAWLQQKYPAAFASDWTQSFPARTEAGLGPDSAWDVQNDVPPRAFRQDFVHLNSYGNELLAELIVEETNRRSW